MRNKIFKLIAIITAILMLACSCSIYNWDDPLPNGYTIWRDGINENYLCKYTSSMKISAKKVIDVSLSEYCYNDTYVGIKCDGDASEDCGYYLVNTETDKVYGPYDSYARFLIALGREHKMGDWISAR